jgi:hypothetical protein
MDVRQSPRYRIDRRRLLCALLIAVLPIGSASADEDMVAFVRGVYAQQVRLHAAGENLREREFVALFSPDMVALMRAPRPGLEGEPAGPLLNAFFGWGVLPGQPVTLMEVAATEGGEVNVDLIVRSERRRVTIRPVRANGLWTIADISYGRGEALRSYYMRITGR